MKRNEESKPWTEKYRPSDVSGLVQQVSVVKTLTSALETGELPHLLFYGPPGCGKTTAALALAHQLFGKHMKDRVLELNASDDRGIAVVRNKIKSFSMSAVGTQSAAPNEAAMPSFKLIILDEADSMTVDAQNALRRTMEVYSKSTRFVFLCNYISRIIDPITSRCAKYRFASLDNNAIVQRLQYICSNENIELDSMILQTIASITEGDLRRAITLLETLCKTVGDNVKANDIQMLSGTVPSTVLHKLLHDLQTHQLNETNQVLRAGYSLSTLLFQLLDVLIDGEVFPMKLTAPIALLIARTDARITQGADEYLQLYDLITSIDRLLVITNTTLQL